MRNNKVMIALAVLVFAAGIVSLILSCNSADRANEAIRSGAGEALSIESLSSDFSDVSRILSSHIWIDESETKEITFDGDLSMIAIKDGPTTTELNAKPIEVHPGSNSGYELVIEIEGVSVTLNIARPSAEEEAAYPNFDYVMTCDSDALYKGKLYGVSTQESAQETEVNAQASSPYPNITEINKLKSFIEENYAVNLERAFADWNENTNNDFTADETYLETETVNKSGNTISFTLISTSPSLGNKMISCSVDTTSNTYSFSLL